MKRSDSPPKAATGNMTAEEDSAGAKKETKDVPPTKRQRVSGTEEGKAEGKDITADGAAATASALKATPKAIKVRPPPPPGREEPTIISHTFPQRLMQMLDKEDVPDALWWATEGKAFAIDVGKFEGVLHNHFQATKYASFTRKLNKWGFRKLNTSDSEHPDSVVLYRHDLFQKDMPNLLKTMSTKRKKKDKKEKGANISKGGGKSGDDTSEDTEGAEQERIDEEGMEGQVVKEDEEKASVYAPLSHREIQEPEAKSDIGMAPDAYRRQQLSLASSLASRRILDAPIYGNALSSLALLQQQAHSQSSLALNPESFTSDERHRLLLESMVVAESELRGQREQLQQQQTFSDELLAQRQLVAAAAAAPMRLGDLGASSTLEDRLLALGDPSLQGIHRLTSSAPADMTGRFATSLPGRPTSLAGIPSALQLQQQQQHTLSDIASSLRGGISPQSEISSLPSPLDLLHSHSSSALRAAVQLQYGQPPTDIASRLQLLSQNQTGAESHSMLQLLSREQGISAMSPSLQLQGLSDPPSALRLQLQLEQQRRQDLQGSGAAAAGFVSTGIGNQSSSADQQLLMIMLERQRLQAQLLLEQQRRQQHE